MILLQISMLAVVLILPIILIRLLAANKVPRITFLVLWGLVLLRLLVPVSIPLPFETQPQLTVINRAAALAANTVNGQSVPVTQNVQIAGPAQAGAIPHRTNGAYVAPEVAAQNPPQVPILAIIWFIGAIGLALFFVVTHIRRRMGLEGSFPLENDYVTGWMREQKLTRTVTARYTDRISTPLTYGIWKPVILFPLSTDWANENQLRYVLTHEMTHIRRFDILAKWLLATALCVHWFNPLVWVMFILANRDIEFACDEAVVWATGENTKSVYALTLIELEERRSGLVPLYNNFARNAIKERIEAIIKLKKKSVVGSAITILLVSLMALYAFAASAESVETPAPYDPVLQAAVEKVVASQEEEYEFATSAESVETPTLYDPASQAAVEKAVASQEAELAASGIEGWTISVAGQTVAKGYAPEFEPIVFSWEDSGNWSITSITGVIINVITAKDFEEINILHWCNKP